MAKSKIVLKKILACSTNLEQWENLINCLNVKFNEHSGWFTFKGVENGMFVLAQRNGETFRTNQIFVSC